MIKMFPKSRVCIVDVYPSFEKGLRAAISFASKHNVLLNSADGRRILMSYCVRFIEADYKSAQSPYPKVMCISKKSISKKIGFSSFFDNYFENILNQMPMPYCGKIDLNSPDLESAATLSLSRPKVQNRYIRLLGHLKIKTEGPPHPILP